MADVVQFRPQLVGDGAKVEADKVLEAAKGRLVTLALVGIDNDGELYVAGTGGAADSVFLMERAKLFLLEHEVLRHPGPSAS